MYLTQFTSECKTRTEADAELAGLRLQEDFIGGRIVDQTRTNGVYMVQVLFPDYGELNMDGCRRCFVFESFLSMMRAA